MRVHLLVEITKKKRRKHSTLREVAFKPSWSQPKWIHVFRHLPTFSLLFLDTSNMVRFETSLPRLYSLKGASKGKWASKYWITFEGLRHQLQIECYRHIEFCLQHGEAKSEMMATNSIEEIQYKPQN
mmetsp:Transcript_29098/g.61903  ORF Transcript_29098/g.61903 Transcript_29098/m.61903 type:complete len:127 (+) Transcript_29098:2507-2887(+)